MDVSNMDEIISESLDFSEVIQEATACTEPEGADPAQEDLSFNAMGGDLSWQTPWDYLCKSAQAITGRAVRCEAEEALLPLLREISALAAPNGDTTGFPELKTILQQHSCKKGVRLAGKLEKTKPGSKKYAALTKKLLDTLNKARWEKVWREVYNKLEASQTEYPGKADALCPPALLRHVRGEIWQRMEQYGYSGSYPAFRRKKFLPGLHLAQSYGVCYWAGMKRNTRFRIHCFETVEDGQLRVRFVTGTALTRRNEKIKDIFSCLFNANGRRFRNEVECTVSLDAQQPEADLAQYVKAAVKKAALRPLSRKEKKAVGQTNKAGFGTFLKEFFLCGGSFALLLVGILALGACTAMYFVDGPEAAKTLLLQFPWWIFLAGAWLIFGLPIAAMVTASKNK